MDLRRNMKRRRGRVKVVAGNLEGLTVVLWLPETYREGWVLRAPLYNGEYCVVVVRWQLRVCGI